MTTRVLGPTTGAPNGTTSTRDTPGHWDQRAACKDTDDDLWFPPGTSFNPMNTADVNHLAATYCNHCPVRRDCYDDAINRGDRVGIRGGTDMATVTTSTRSRHRARNKTAA